MAFDLARQANQHYAVWWSVSLESWRALKIMNHRTYSYTIITLTGRRYLSINNLWNGARPIS